MKGFRYIDNVATLEYEPSLCVGCGLCELVCPHGVFAVEKGKASVVDLDACMECGACARNCAAGAIAVRAGVGCALGLLSGALGVKSACCCSDETACPP